MSEDTKKPIPLSYQPWIWYFTILG